MLAACGGGIDEQSPNGEPAEESEQTADALAGGTISTLRPEVGQFEADATFGGTPCTATLIHPQHVITAAHCINYFQPSVPAGPFGMFVIGEHVYRVDRVHAFTRFLTEGSVSGTRNMDVALLHLETAVPSTVATPARLADKPPAAGGLATAFGYGCPSRSSASTGDKRYFVFTYGQATQTLCQGDSGGPVFVGNQNAHGALWGINSSYSPSTGNDTFADAAYLKPQIEALIRQWNGGLEPGFRRSLATAYRSVSVHSATACQSACRADPGCRAFTFDTTSLTLAPRCHLLSGAAPMLPTDGYVSGLPSVATPDLTFTSAPYATLTNIATAERCAARCGESVACRQWRWEPDTCTLSTTAAPFTPCTNCAAGSKDQAREVDINRAGNDYASVASLDAVRCEILCSLEYRCKAYTHVAAGVIGAEARCFLKDAPGVPSALLGATSGVRRGLEINTDRPGSNLSSFTLPDPTPERCQAACRNDDDCKAWTYTPASTAGSRPRCALKGAVPARYSTINMISGAGSNGTWVRARDTDASSGSYRSFSVVGAPGKTAKPVTVEICEAKCKDEEPTQGCRAWSFHPRTEARAARCHLVSSTPFSRHTQNVVSGIKGLEFFP